VVAPRPFANAVNQHLIFDLVFNFCYDLLDKFTTAEYLLITQFTDEINWFNTISYLVHSLLHELWMGTKGKSEVNHLMRYGSAYRYFMAGDNGIILYHCGHGNHKHPAQSR
jgi:hypothetical protein